MMLGAATGARATSSVAAKRDTTSHQVDSTVKSQTGAAVKDTSAGARIYEYIAHPVAQILTLPIEKVLVPVVGVLIYPTKEPIRYVLDENIIDRTMGLVTYGGQQQIQAYPTLNLAPGTGSRTGFTFRDRDLFGRPDEQLVSYILYYVNGDYKARAYVTANNMIGSDLSSKMGAVVTRMKNASVNEPGTDYFLFYSDTSEQYQFQLTYPLLFSTQLRTAFTPRHNHFGTAPPNLLNPDTLVGSFFPNKGTDLQSRQYRGLEQSYWDRQWEIGLTRDTRNNENITLDGSWLDATLRYHDADLGHSFYEWIAQYTTYFQLGREKYEITAEEEKRNGNLSIQKIMQQLEYEKIRQGIFERKVLVLHFYAAQSYEINGNSMPVYGLQTLGNDTPLRGYPGARFRDYTVAEMSTEYRFPVIRLMDGDIFDEYGVSGRSWQGIDYLNYKNSWGFGIRVRRPDIFLFRMELGIHGVSGAVLNISVDAPF